MFMDLFFCLCIYFSMHGENVYNGEKWERSTFQNLDFEMPLSRPAKIQFTHLTVATSNAAPRPHFNKFHKCSVKLLSSSTEGRTNTDRFI